MRQASNDYGWKEKSEAEGFIIAFTNGTSGFQSQVLATWNAGTCCAYARDNNVDDVAYTKHVIADIKREFNVRADAVFATGFSNGGMMMHRLACEAPELFRAVAAVSGTDGMTTCAPKKQIPIMHIHAIDDTHVLFYGGAGDDAFRDVSQVTEFTSVPDTVTHWVARYGLSSTPTRVLENDGAYCDLYTGSTLGGKFELCVTPDGKHSWPDAKDASHSGAIPTKTINGNNVVWNFFMGQL
jgi:polyhydroxybutyrate depolymerase